jgi:hypothetical protein
MAQWEMRHHLHNMVTEGPFPQHSRLCHVVRSLVGLLDVVRWFPHYPTLGRQRSSVQMAVCSRTANISLVIPLPHFYSYKHDSLA